MLPLGSGFPNKLWAEAKWLFFPGSYTEWYSFPPPHGNVREHKSEVKYLRNNHIQITGSKVTKALMVWENLVGLNLGLQHKYSAVDVNDYNLTKYNTCITGVMRMYPTVALELIPDLILLHLVIQRAAIEATLRVTREGTGNERMRSQRDWSVLTSSHI